VVRERETGGVEEDVVMAWWLRCGRGVRFCESDGRGRRRIWGCSGRVRQRRDGKCGGWLAWLLRVMVIMASGSAWGREGKKWGGVVVVVGTVKRGGEAQGEGGKREFGGF